MHRFLVYLSVYLWHKINYFLTNFFTAVPALVFICNRYEPLARFATFNCTWFSLLTICDCTALPLISKSCICSTPMFSLLVTVTTLLAALGNILHFVANCSLILKIFGGTSFNAVILMLSNLCTI